MSRSSSSVLGSEGVSGLLEEPEGACWGQSLAGVSPKSQPMRRYECIEACDKLKIGWPYCYSPFSDGVT
jgi:hypothetical protein